MAVVDSSRTAPASRPGRAELAAALRDATYEVLPFKTAEEKVLADVPTDVALTVTTTEAKGLGPTVDLAVRLTAAGYRRHRTWRPGWSATAPTSRTSSPS